ncbi:MAG: phosphoribosylaminoimidazolesuccinocarboxamide synthase [Candidatus Omnitrophota bacterium]|nr:phosphoribosylaminoimidazolesuccinocarboxamide synthase [Candidatus Omnitrophota bacterium]
MEEVLLTTNLAGVKLAKRGKVRDVYDVGEHLLIVSTDRISAFDVVMPNGIPNKGKVLNTISLFWFDYVKDIIPNHVVTADVNEYPRELAPHRDILRGRSMLVKKTKPLAFECVVRGYLAGSAYKEYKEKQEIAGIKLPSGLLESSRFPEPLFTPATKEEQGHDINVSVSDMERGAGVELTSRVKDASLKVYNAAVEYAAAKSIIIADTKFEFGVAGDAVILIDEVLTPDSSRFWPSADYSPGRPQASFDKQFVRDYLESISWNKTPPAPILPRDVVAKTEEKYKEALKVLTGISL